MISLEKSHIKKLLEITEDNIRWFQIYHPSVNIDFKYLLKRNYQNLHYYLIVTMLGEYDNEIINNKLEKTHRVFKTLYNISEMNKNIKI